MNMPGMAGEAAIYRTNNYYRATAGGSLANNGNMAVIPQDCEFYKELLVVFT